MLYRSMDIKEVYEARERLDGVIHSYISLEKSNHFSLISGAEVYLKCENRQKTGSFKVRGAYNKIEKISKDGKITHVIAASAGNHAQGVAYAARDLGIDATIVMPKGTSLAKIVATQHYDGEVILSGETFDEAYTHAKQLAKELDATFIEPFNDADVIAGQGTVGLEIYDDLPDADIVVVPVGGGGLIAGIAFTLKTLNPKMKIVGVQAQKADAMVRSFKSGKLEPLTQMQTIADGIAVKRPGEKPFELIKEYVDEMVTVTDDEIAMTILELMERTKQVVEPAGAASLAAVVTGRIKCSGKKVVCVLSGGNIDIGFIDKIIEKGLVRRGRCQQLAILLPDVPGSLEKVAGIIARANANITGVRYDRGISELQINDVILHLNCEVSNKEHGETVIADLEAGGFTVVAGKK